MVNESESLTDETSDRTEHQLFSKLDKHSRESALFFLQSAEVYRGRAAEQQRNGSDARLSERFDFLSRKLLEIQICPAK